MDTPGGGEVTIEASLQGNTHVNPYAERRRDCGRGDCVWLFGLTG
jgi:hypothetical protein